MNSYDFLAGCYDELTYDVDYSAWADYVEKHFRRRPLPGKTIVRDDWRGPVSRDAGRGGGKKRKRGRNSAHVFMPEHGEAGSVRDH